MMCKVRVCQNTVQKRASSALSMPACAGGLKKASKASKLEVGEFPTLNLAVLEYKHRTSKGCYSSSHLPLNHSQIRL